MKNKSYIKYLFGAIIGFLVFAISMIFVEQYSIFVILGMLGMVGMNYFLKEIFYKA